MTSIQLPQLFEQGIFFNSFKVKMPAFRFCALRSHELLIQAGSFDLDLYASSPGRRDVSTQSYAH